MTAQSIADTLNRAMSLDPACINSLFEIRRICNKSLADHPTIQVGTGKEGDAFLRFVGLLNGMLLDSGSTDVVTEMYEDGDSRNIVRFSTIPYSQVS